MQQPTHTYNFLQKAATVFLMVMLIWLTVSTPFIINSQQFQNDDVSATWPCSDDDGCDTSGNDVEEKAPAGSNLSDEFLHEHYYATGYTLITSSNHRQENMDVYIAFHGELHAPPPNAV